MSERQARIVLVGHCGPDAYMLLSAVQRAVPGARVEMVSDEAALERERGADLLLINRVLDGDFDTESGTELIVRLAGRRGADGRPVLMLVSNFEEAQEEAVEAGAVRGFGKKEAYSDASARRLREAVGGAGSENE
jgi:hypothetical protein